MKLISALRGPADPSCSMLPDTELEHPVRRLVPLLYLRCCLLLPAGDKFVSKMLAKTTYADRLDVARVHREMSPADKLWGHVKSEQAPPGAKAEEA